MMMFDKLSRKWWSSSTHRTDTVRAMSQERSVAASSIRLDRKHQSFFDHTLSFWNEVQQGRHTLQIRSDYLIRTTNYRFCCDTLLNDKQTF